jgi:hypothetical protein
LPAIPPQEGKTVRYVFEEGYEYSPTQTLDIIIVYEQREYDALTKQNKWDERILGSTEVFECEGIANPELTNRFWATWRSFLEPGLRLEFKSTSVHIGGAGTGIPYERVSGHSAGGNAAGFRDRFKAKYWSMIQKRMEDILRAEGVYKYQTFFDQEDDSEPLVLDGPEQPKLTYNKPPQVDKMTVRIERGGPVFRLFLNFSQRERAVIKEYGLDKLVIEQESIYSKQKLADMKALYDAALAREGDRKRKSQMQSHYAEMLRAAQSQSVPRYITDFMTYPYERRFETALEATEYSDKLNRSLQQFRAKLITYLEQSESESVEFVDDDEYIEDDEDDQNDDYQDDDEDYGDDEE